MPEKTKFFDFRQNNSGGSFSGPAIHVVIEAVSADDANSRAEEKGLYFNGCDTGMDCGCCGDRWYLQWTEGDGDSTPSTYGEPLTDPPNVKYDWSNDEIPHAIVYYLDGTENIYKTK